MKETEPAGIEGINYFIVDLVVTLLSWSTTAIPEVSQVNFSEKIKRIYVFLRFNIKMTREKLFS